MTLGVPPQNLSRIPTEEMPTEPAPVRLPSDRVPAFRLVWFALFAMAMGQPFRHTSGCSGNRTDYFTDEQTLPITAILLTLLAASTVLPMLLTWLKTQPTTRRAVNVIAIPLSVMSVLAIWFASHVEILGRAKPDSGAYLSALAFLGCAVEATLRAIADRAYLRRTRAAP